MSWPGGRGTDGANGGSRGQHNGYYGPAEDERAHEPRPGRRGQDQRRPSRGSIGTWHDTGGPGGYPGEQPAPSWEQTGPPWDSQAGYHPDQVPQPGPGRGHPSGPLPPLPQPGHDWPGGYRYPDDAGSYPDDAGGYPDYPPGGGSRYPGPGSRYRDEPGDSRYQDEPGYPADPSDTGYGYQPRGGYPDPGYEDTGTGYDYPAYHDDGFTDGGDGYADGDYRTRPAGGRAYPGYDDTAAGGRVRGSNRDYRDRAGWYGDVTDEQSRVQDDGDFVPGLGTGTQPRVGGYPADGRRAPSGRRPGRGGKRKRGMRRAAPWLALSIVLVLLLGAGGAGFYVYRTYLHPPDYSGPGTGTVTVRIYPGDSAAAVGRRLAAAGVVASARAFYNAAKASGHGSALEPGYYRVHRHMQASLAFALLMKPSARVQTKIVIQEGLRLSQIIAKLGSATGNLRGYQQAIKDVAALHLPSYAKGNPEGYLFPATYPVQPGTPPIQVLQAMVSRFKQEANSIKLPAAAAKAQLTPAGVIIIASLIQAEGRKLSDFPKIAEVIYNRLNASPQMPLQLDTTVLYVLHKFSPMVTTAQTQVKSPYNTYLHAGLPPGPIDSPGDAAIQAALHPAHGGLLYFVAVDPKTGLTKFTSMYSQFLQFKAELAANIAKGQ